MVAKHLFEIGMIFSADDLDERAQRRAAVDAADRAALVLEGDRRCAVKASGDLFA